MDSSPRVKYFLLLPLAVFAAAALAKLGMPLLEWDSVSLEAAKAWASGSLHPWLFDHPPLYPFYLVLPFRFFGASPETARIFNIFPVLAAACLVYLTAQRLSGRLPGVIAASLYLVNPVTIQGLQSLDSSDTTLLPLCFALIAYVLSRSGDEPRRRGFVLSLLFALALWAKVTSSLALIAGSVLYLLAFRERGDKALRSALFYGVFGGLALFIVSWSAVSLPLWGSESWAAVLVTPFRHLRPALPSSGGLVLKWGLDLARIAFWFSPFLLYLSFAGIRNEFKLKAPSGAARLLAFLCFFYFAGHIFIGGSNYGYPRYHAAISPLLHVFAGLAAAGAAGGLTAARGWKLIVPVCLFSVLAVVYADPELLINLELKRLFFFKDYPGIVTRVLAPLLALAALPFAAGAAYGKLSGNKGAPAAAAAAALLGLCAALAVKQGLAGYSTAYQYGASGKDSVLELVSGKLSGGETILATPEFLYDLRSQNVAGPRWSAWRSESDIYGVIDAQEPAFIIAGWTTHTQAQLNYMLGEGKIRDLLEKKYALFKTGTYFVWENKKAVYSGKGDKI